MCVRVCVSVCVCVSVGGRRRGLHKAARVKQDSALASVVPRGLHSVPPDANYRPTSARPCQSIS